MTEEYKMVSWQTPELVILGRGRAEESLVVEICKGTTFFGPDLDDCTHCGSDCNGISTS